MCVSVCVSMSLLTVRGRGRGLASLFLSLSLSLAINPIVPDFSASVSDRKMPNPRRQTDRQRERD